MNSPASRLALLAAWVLAFPACDRSNLANAERITPAPPSEPTLEAPVAAPREEAQPTASTPVDPPTIQEDAIGQELLDYRMRVRLLYNSQQFAALEAAADEARAGKKRFGSGAWEIFHFYDCLQCRDDEPESMWQLHDRIHQAWTSAYPESVTPRIAHADFFTTYAWHARGSAFATKVNPKNWQLFEERLATARQILDAAAAFKTKCPMWWRVQQTVAIGQGWTRAAYDTLFEEAKAFEPQFWSHDIARANYLLPRWHGAEGDWEKAAEREITRPGSLGLEGYARVVTWLRGYYDNIFQDTKASWPLVREGFAEMRKKYPDSLEILSGYAQVACIAGDRELARKLFGEIGGRVDRGVWGTKTEKFLRFRNWAFADTPTNPPPLNP